MQTTTAKRPLPGTQIEGVRLVVDSRVPSFADEAVALLLNPVEPYYSVARVRLDSTVGWYIVREVPWTKFLSAVSYFMKETR